MKVKLDGKKNVLTVVLDVDQDSEVQSSTGKSYLLASDTAKFVAPNGRQVKVQINVTSPVEAKKK